MRRINLACAAVLFVYFSAAAQTPMGVDATHFLPSLLVGLLTPSRWYVSVVTAWGALLLGALGFIGYVRGVPGASPLDLLYYSAPIVAVSLLGGFEGSRLASKRARDGAT